MWSTNDWTSKLEGIIRKVSSTYLSIGIEPGRFIHTKKEISQSGTKRWSHGDTINLFIEVVIEKKFTKVANVRSFLKLFLEYRVGLEEL